MSLVVHFDAFLGELKRRRILRVAFFYAAVAWVLLQLSEITFPAFGIPDATIRALVIALIVGFPMVIIVAWFASKGPRERSADLPVWFESAALAGILGLALGLAWLLYMPDEPDSMGSIANQSGTATDDRSIAVLPFTNMSSDADNEYFSDGISEELLNVLARIEGLQVAARTSSFAYKGTKKSIQDVGQELGVQTVLEGSVRKSGEEVRITAQLINVSDGMHLWSQTYDRKLTDVFAIQDEIAGSIVDALKMELLGAQRDALADRATENVDAYQAYLLGCHHWYKRTADDIELAVRYFEQAIKADPDYVPAYTGLADSYMLLTSYGNMTNYAALPKAEEAIAKAMELDPDLSEAHASKGLLYIQHQKPDEAKKELQRALELDPDNAMAHLWYGIALSSLEEDEASVREYQLAYALEPMSKPINTNLAWGLLERGRYDESRVHMERMVRLDEPNVGRYLYGLAVTHHLAGSLAEAVQWYRRSLAYSPENEDAMGGLSQAYLDLGDLENAQIWADRAIDLDPMDGNAVRASLFVRIANNDLGGITPFIEDRMTMEGDRENPIGLVTAGLVEMELGKIEVAREYFDEFRALYSGRIEVTEFFLFPALATANFYLKHGDSERAEPEMARDALARAREKIEERFSRGYHSVDLYYQLATLEAIEGKNAAALNAMREAVALGYRSAWLAMRDPSLASVRDDIGFVNLIDEMKGAVSQESAQLANMSLVAYREPEERVPVAVSQSVLKHYVGHYQPGEGDTPIQIFLEDRVLNVRYGDDQPFELAAASVSDFYNPLRADVYRFVADEDGEITHMLMLAAGGEQRAKRIEWRQPELAEVDPATYEAFVGEYEVLEQFRVSVIREGDQLFLQSEGQTRQEILPFSENAFFLEGNLTTLTFVGAEDGPAEMILVHRDGVDMEAPRIDEAMLAN